MYSQWQHFKNKKGGRVKGRQNLGEHISSPSPPRKPSLGNKEGLTGPIGAGQLQHFLARVILGVLWELNGEEAGVGQWDARGVVPPGHNGELDLLPIGLHGPFPPG